MKLDFYGTHRNFPNTVGQPEWNSGYCPRGIAEGTREQSGVPYNLTRGTLSKTFGRKCDLRETPQTFTRNG